MHTLILSAANNPFFNQSLEIISVIFHSHYQWDESDLKQRNIVALEEHMAILTALISRRCGRAVRACASQNRQTLDDPLYPAVQLKPIKTTKHKRPHESETCLQHLPRFTSSLEGAP